MEQNTGTISILAERSGLRSNEDDILTVAEAQEFLRLCRAGETASPLLSEAKMRYLLSRIKPWSALIPGSALHMQQQQRQLLAMIASPVTTDKGSWSYFVTMVQPDHHSPDLYDNIITSACRDGIDFTSSLEDRRRAADGLSAAERLKLLRAHPVLSARLFALQQNAFFKHILCGGDKPLGLVLDFWRRVEFQARDTPHSHNLVCVAKDGCVENSIVLSETPSELELSNLSMLGIKVAGSITARLQPRALLDDIDVPAQCTNLEEAEALEGAPSYLYCPTVTQKSEHPSKWRFSATGKDFRYDRCSDCIPDPAVQQQFRRLQLHCQMHRCTFTCFKYCRAGHAKCCRFRFPKKRYVNNEHNTVISQTRDHKNKPRVTVEPPRNNININQHFKSPLALIAANANVDVAKTDKVTGSAVYASAYAAKGDMPDEKALQNAISRKLAFRAINTDVVTQPTTKQMIHTVASAVAQSKQYGDVQCAYIVMKLPLVISSRENVNLNALQRKEIEMHSLITNTATLADMDDTASAVNASPTCQLGRRDMYHMLYLRLLKLYGTVSITFYSYLMSFRPVRQKGKKSIDPPNLQLNEAGLITNAVTFVINSVRITHFLFITHCFV